MYSIEEIEDGFVVKTSDENYPAQFVLSGNPQGEELENHGGEFAIFQRRDQAQAWIEGQE
jgi:hypothetical protein